MPDQEKKRSKKYNRVREKFEELPLEEKATFLVEAVFTTLTRGIEQAGKAFSDELNSMFDQARERAEKKASGAGDGSAGSDDGEEGGEPEHDQDEHASDEPAEEEN